MSVADISSRTGKQKCPQCSHLRKNKSDKPLSVHYDNGEMFFKCHHCQWKGKLGGQSWAAPKVYRRPEFKAETPTDKLIGWFAQRGIPKSVIERNRITAVEHFGKRMMAFPYYREGELVNVKYRSADKQFQMEAECELVLYGMDDIAGDTLIFVEGEIDKLSLEVAGFTNCVSVPNGAGTNLNLLEAAERWIEPLKKIIWAGDNDEAGRRLEAEAIRRLGPERCYRVEWPDDCKDANEVLTKYGKEAIVEAIESARAVPIEGAFEVYDLIPDLIRLYETGRPRGEHPGWNLLANHYRPRPGDWTVITGAPGSGKSVFLAALMVNLASSVDWRFVVYPPENLPPAEYVSMILELRTGLPFNDGPNTRMTSTEMLEAARWAHDHFVVLNPEDNKRNIEELLELTRSYVFRRGVNGLVIDPWNEIEHAIPPGQTETQYISESLIRIRQFSRLSGLHTWVVVHPTKLQKDGSGRYPVATLYDCAGSAAWFNKCDMGISIWRDKSNDAAPVEIHIQKVRFRWCGELGMVPLHYDKVTGRYYEVRPELRAVEGY